jgi:hypothetical protein
MHAREYYLVCGMLITIQSPLWSPYIHSNSYRAKCYLLPRIKKSNTMYASERFSLLVGRVASVLDSLIGSAQANMVLLGSGQREN